MVQTRATSSGNEANVGVDMQEDVAPPTHALMPKPRLAPLPNLSKDNFRPWKIVLRSHLACFGLDHLMDPEKTFEPSQFAQAKSYIIGTLGESDYKHVEHARSFYELLEALRTARHGRMEQHQVELASKLLSYRIRADQSISEFCDQMRTTCEQLNDAGVEFHDLLLSVWTLTCARLDPRYTAQCDTMLGLGIKLTMDHVQSALKAVEEKHGSQVPSATGLSALKGVKRANPSDDVDPFAALAKRVHQLSSSLGKFKSSGGNASGSGNGGGKADPRRETPRGADDRSRVRSPLKPYRCNNCNGYGHGYRECKKPCQACGRRGHSSHMCRTNPQGPNQV